MVLIRTRNRFRTQPVRSVQVEKKRGVYINYLAMYVFFKDISNPVGTYLFRSMEG